MKEECRNELALLFFFAKCLIMLPFINATPSLLGLWKMDRTIAPVTLNSHLNERNGVTRQVEIQMDRGFGC